LIIGRLYKKLEDCLIELMNGRVGKVYLVFINVHILSYVIVFSKRIYVEYSGGHNSDYFTKLNKYELHTVFAKQKYEVQCI